MSRLLVDWVAKNKLKKNEIDSLTLDGLRYLLKKTQKIEKPFATPEFEVWECALTKAEKEFNDNLVIKREIEKFKEYINLKRMDAEEIKKHVEPFKIHSDEELKEVYSTIALGKGLEFIRGVPIFKWKSNISNLKVFKGGFTVEANESTQPKSILGDLVFKSRGVYEWSILIKKLCKTIYIGICDINENLNTDKKYHGLVLGSDGYVYYGEKWKWYDAKFKEGDKVTVRLNMKMKTCAFSINNIRKPIVSVWENIIPFRVCPVVSLGHGSKLRLIQEFYD